MCGGRYQELQQDHYVGHIDSANNVNHHLDDLGYVDHHLDLIPA